MDAFDELLGTSPAIVALRKQLRQALGVQRRSRRVPPLLLQGETGTGKGLLARLIHRASARSRGPFVDVNCAAIPETLLEAELFGFERGAFTDAREAKPGLIRAADGGTLLLDEVDLLSEALQAKFLTALEERTVRPLGSTRSHPVDVGIITASNRDLEGEVRARRFREDLYHRLAVLTVWLPPLRERRDDIVPLAEHFLLRDCAEYGLPSKQLSAGARAALRDYSWPGNVRELANVIERAVLLAETSLIASEALGLRTTNADERSAAGGALDSLVERIASVEHGELLGALRATGWNVSRAARRLGVARHWLRYRMEKFQLSGTRSGAKPVRRETPQSEPAVLTETSAPLQTVPSPAVRWEPRQVAFLRGILTAPSASPAPDTGLALSVVVEKVKAFGGRVLEVGSTTLVAGFGLEPAENAPTIAALAAVAALKAVERSHRADPRFPGVAVAIHVALVEVCVVDGAAQIDAEDKQRAWTALAELLAATTSQTISVSPATLPFLDRRFDLLRTASGDPAGRESHRLALRESTGFHLGARHLTRFVGRDDELAIMEDRLGQAARGHGQVVCVVGEPGVGKSRFIYEVTRSDRARGWRVLYGRTVSSDVATPWLPVSELLKRHFGVDDSDLLPQIREEVTAGMRARSLKGDIPAILALLDLPVEDPAWRALDPPQRRQRLVDGVKRVLIGESERQPLLLVFEDLHWADTETRAFLDTLVDRLPTAAILLIVTSRPGSLQGWASKTYYAQLCLGGLSDESAADMLAALLGADSALDELKGLLIANTDGNPLFIEESVRSLVETGALSGTPGAYSVSAAAPRIEVPATVQAILAARIHRLPAESRRLLEAAAVIGKDIPSALLQVIAELSGVDLRRGLADLQAAEFLYEVGRSPDVTYTFKHALTHDVAYGSLPLDRRRGLHARIVAAMERLYADRLAEHVERLGDHALAGEVWDKALHYLRQAGTKAFERSANREAVACLDHALDALRHLPETPEALKQAVDLRLDLRNPLVALGEFGKAHDRLREAETFAATLGDQRSLGLVINCLSGLFAYTGDYHRGIEFGRRALAVGENLDDLGIAAVANLYMGAARFCLGDYPAAVASFSLTTASLTGELNRERLGQSMPPAVLARAWMGWALGFLGRFADAIASGEEAIRIAEGGAHPQSRVFAMAYAGDTHLLKGDLDTAIRLLEQGLALCRATDIQLAVPMIAAGLGYARALTGRQSDGLVLLREAVEVDVSIRQMTARALWVGFLGEACLLAGLLDQAIMHAAHALELSRAHGARGWEAWSLRLLGEIYSNPDARDAGRAEDSYREAMALATELGMRPLIAHCHLGLGKGYARTGRREEARRHLDTATTMYREMDMLFWREKAEVETAT